MENRKTRIEKVKLIIYLALMIAITVNMIIFLAYIHSNGKPNDKCPALHKDTIEVINNK